MANFTSILDKINKDKSNDKSIMFGSKKPTSILDKIAYKDTTVTPQEYISKFTEPTRTVASEISAQTPSVAKTSILEKIKETTPVQKVESLSDKPNYSLTGSIKTATEYQTTRPSALKAQEIKSKYGVDVKTNVYSPIQLSTELAKSGLTGDDRENLKKDYEQYIVFKNQEKPFSAGADVGVNILPTAFETAGRGTEELAKTQSTLPYKAGQMVGELTKFAPLYATVGAGVEGALPTISQTQGGLGGAVGTLAPTIGQKLGYSLGSGVAGGLATELAKDVVIGGAVGGAEAAASGQNITESIGRNIAQDIMFNAILGVGGKVVGSLADVFKRVKTPQVIEQVAKQANVTTEQASKLIDDISPDVLNKVRTATQGVEPKMVGVIPEADKTLTLYHGSNREFDAIKPGRAQAGEGVFLTDTPATARNYGSNLYEIKIEPKKIATDSDYISARNDLINDIRSEIRTLDNSVDEMKMSFDEINNIDNKINSLEKQISDLEDSTLTETNAKITSKLKENGFDVLKTEMQSGEKGFEYLVLDEKAIKSTSKASQEQLSKPIKLSERVRQTETKPITMVESPTTVLDTVSDQSRIFDKFKLDMFGATKEKPVDALFNNQNVRVVDVFQDSNGKQIAKLVDGTEVDANMLKPQKGYKPKITDDLAQVFTEANKLKDVGTTSRWTTDVFRNFESVFGKNSKAYKVVKENLLDPFDKAKGNMADDVIRYTDDLKKTIVDDLGIKPKSKESKFVMRYGEGNIDKNGLIKEFGAEKADKIIQADAWFRKQYDELLDAVNLNRLNMNKEAIPKRTDYYRHYNEIANTFESIKNIIESGRAIDPRLSGLSEFTKPREAWASFKQKRTDGTKFTEDAVGGFLDYVRAATYAKNIDPIISEFRSFRNSLANATTDTRNINRFIEYLDDFSNDLAGKTNPFDRWIQKAIGRERLAMVNAVNSRVKANAVLGNLSSSLSQIANVPQGIATIKDPRLLFQGADNFIKSIGGGGDAALYKQSSFLKERFLQDAYSQFNTRLIDQPKKAAAWMLGALDEVGTKFIWSSAHAKALKEGVQNPIKYADDITRKLVAGRGIGEVPIAQKSNAMQLVAPFTVEVNNMWKVMKDMGADKDIAGLTLLFISNHILNKGMEQTRGSGVTYDPIQAVIDGLETEGDFGDKLVGVGGNLAGETLSNLPLGSSIASTYPEYGARIGNLEIPTRAELFGEADPTRYGVSMPVVKAIQDPLKNLLLPWGGGQVSKTISGAQTMGLLPQLLKTEEGAKYETLPASVSKSGRLRTLVEPSPLKTAQSLAFGGYSPKEVQDYFKENTTPFGENQTAKIFQLVNEGFEPKKLQSALQEARGVKTKDEIRDILEKNGYGYSDMKRIMEYYFGYKGVK